MALRPAHTLAALFLEHPDLRSACFAVDNRDDSRVGDKRRTREEFSAVFLDDEHLVERQFSAGIARGSIQGRDTARCHLALMATCLNDCVHYRHLCKGDSLLSNSLRCKELSPGVESI